MAAGELPFTVTPQILACQRIAGARGRRETLPGFKELGRGKQYAGPE
jgi:hypothetical protein